MVAFYEAIDVKVAKQSCLAVDGRSVLERLDGQRIFWTNNIETLFQELNGRGTQTKGGLVTKDYGCREFVVIAPDGREIVFGEIVAS